MPAPIANPTAEQLRDRRKSTAWRRKQAARALEAANSAATHCQRRQPGGTCGARMVERTDRALGTVRFACPACERRVAGICRDCPRPVEGRVGQALRCAGCKVRERTMASRRYSARHRDELQEKFAKQYRSMPEEKRRAKLEAKKQWRRANPEKVRAYREREKVTRADKIRAYHEKRRRERRAEINAKARAYYYEHRPLPTVKPCRDCGAEIKWAPPGRPKVRCDACVPASVRARRRQVIPDYTRPTLVRPARACIVRGCTTTVSHRRKKCDSCKAKHLRMARLLLGSRAAA